MRDRDGDVAGAAVDTVIGDVEEEDEDEEEEAGEASGILGVNAQFTRIKDNALRFFERKKNDLSEKWDRVQDFAAKSDKYSFFKKDDPDVLMKIALSKNQVKWKFGVEALATMVRVSKLSVLTPMRPAAHWLLTLKF